MSNPNKNIPNMGILGLKQNWRKDLQSGFLVFLLALPLCLGVALASGFPTAAGIIPAVVGGLLVSRINGTFVTITGPSAGLIVVLLAAVESLGKGDMMVGYQLTLAAIVISGFLQVIAGYFKVGKLGSLFPATVVHGMLAAIGIIIIAKQIHIMLGVNTIYDSIFKTIGQIPNSFLHPTPGIAVIGLIGLAILIFWPHIKHPFLKKIPSPLVVLVVGMGLGQMYGVQHEHFHLFFLGQVYLEEHEHLVAPEYLVDIPDQISSIFYFPDFSKVMSMEFLAAVTSLFLIGSLESSVGADAIDKLDPYKRESDLDKDLTANGVGNIVCGFLGGLPLMTEIVRSSANIENGARTGWANFFHGLIFLVFVILFPHLIHNIPLATLAALLVYTGYRLADPQKFKEVLDVGVDQLVLFSITIIGVLATDILIGIILGVITKLVIELIRGVWPENIFKIYFELQRPDDKTILIVLSGSALFSNFLPLKNALSELEPGKSIIFDFSEGYLIDHSVMKFIDDFNRDYIAQGGECKMIGQVVKKFSNHELAAQLMTTDDRKK
ncbi:MAG: SulP family inorganic anion transporter [Methylococcaceae bacterium]|nr:SulP family inorganic anion transporter [Methylococcaceae bacterium]